MDTQKAVLVFSLRNLKRTLDYLNIDDDNVETMLDAPIPAYLICVSNSMDKDTKIFERNHENVLNLTFDDSTFNQKDVVLFTREQADEILRFVEPLKKLKSYNLTVQCEAGMSRSGAIGEVLNDYLGLDYKEFKYMNPQVMPNSLVRSILKKAIEEKEEVSLHGEEIVTPSEHEEGK